MFFKIGKKMKKTILYNILMLLLVTICLVGCNQNDLCCLSSSTNLFSNKELNCCLGYGVLLPKQEADEIILSATQPIFEEDFADNPHCIVGLINDVILIFDEYDLHIKLRIMPNQTGKEEIEIEDKYEVIELNNKKVIKTIVQENIVKYKFIDRAYYYEVNCNFKDEERVDENTPNINNKTFEENIKSLETFISLFTRYSYY